MYVHIYKIIYAMYVYLSFFHLHPCIPSVKALERHKASGTGDNAEEILEAVQEEVTSKHREDQQKQTKKINSLVCFVYYHCCMFVPVCISPTNCCTLT